MYYLIAFLGVVPLFISFVLACTGLTGKVHPAIGFIISAAWVVPFYIIPYIGLAIVVIGVPCSVVGYVLGKLVYDRDRKCGK